MNAEMSKHIADHINGKYSDSCGGVNVEFKVDIKNPAESFQITHHAIDMVERVLGLPPKTLQERALWYLPVEEENPLYSVDDNLLPAYIYKECGSISMYQYFLEKDVPTLHSFVRWLTNTKQLHFDKPPVPGDILFLQNNGTIIAARLVISVEEHKNPPETYDSTPVWQRKNLERVRAGMKKTYTVTLHDWYEPVHVWYAVGKVTS